MTAQELRLVVFASKAFVNHYDDREFCKALFCEIWGERLGAHFLYKFDENDPLDFILDMSDEDVNKFIEYAADKESFREAAYKKMYGRND